MSHIITTNAILCFTNADVTWNLYYSLVCVFRLAISVSCMYNMYELCWFYVQPIEAFFVILDYSKFPSILFTLICSILLVVLLHQSLTLHEGQTKPLMFSTTPMIGSLTFWQNRISFLTSCNDTSYRKRKRQKKVSRKKDQRKERLGEEQTQQ